MMKPTRLIGVMILISLLAGIVLSCDSSDETLPDRTPLQTSPDFVGDITKIQPKNENDLLGTILVEGADLTYTSDKYVITVNDETLILKQDGASLRETSFEMMVPGQEVRIWFFGPVRESYPAQVDAAQIVISRLTSVKEVGLGEEFWLVLGQSAGIEGESLSVTLEAILGDSRCPQGATCVWAGEVTVTVEIDGGDSPGSVKLTQSGLTDGYSSAAFGDYTIAFKVLPYPKLGEDISPEEYRLWLTVRKAQQKGLLQGHVTIGPIHPVQQPGDNPNDVPPEVYDARKVMVYDQFGKKLISLIDIGHDGNYHQELTPGMYVIDINHAGIDRSSDVPRTVQILAGETVQLNIDIDTGIR